MMGYYYDGYYPRHDGFEMFFGMIFVVIIVSLIIVAARRHGMCHGKHCGGYKEIGGASALDILKERYAKGEIEKAEYEEKKKTLME